MVWLRQCEKLHINILSVYVKEYKSLVLQTQTTHLTPWNWVIFEKATVAQPLKKLSTLWCGSLPCSQRSELLHTLSQKNPVYTCITYLCKIHNNLLDFIFVLMHATCLAHLILFDRIILMIFSKSAHYEVPHYAISSSLHYFISVRPKNYAQHPVLKHPQPTIFA
jgi:hypothetical protein